MEERDKSGRDHRTCTLSSMRRYSSLPSPSCAHSAFSLTLFLCFSTSLFLSLYLSFCLSIYLFLSVSLALFLSTSSLSVSLSLSSSRSLSLSPFCQSYLRQRATCPVVCRQEPHCARATMPLLWQQSATCTTRDNSVFIGSKLCVASLKHAAVSPHKSLSFLRTRKPGIHLLSLCVISSF